jgi:hypothetical protein
MCIPGRKVVKLEATNEVTLVLALKCPAPNDLEAFRVAAKKVKRLLTLVKADEKAFPLLFARKDNPLMRLRLRWAKEALEELEATYPDVYGYEQQCKLPEFLPLLMKIERNRPKAKPGNIEKVKALFLNLADSRCLDRTGAHKRAQQELAILQQHLRHYFG